MTITSYICTFLRLKSSKLTLQPTSKKVYCSAYLFEYVHYTRTKGAKTIDFSVNYSFAKSSPFEAITFLYQSNDFFFVRANVPSP
ncbi:hypothetical protein SDC9_175890 [bioreactor metagenome]|uniref:Uncharacterized protein n=1 Tax=bioreactor metagenome TaxID=1076179 RepID=A0A645GNF3_9ZZZZ|nr:hypothetical protein K4E_11710 [Enterococcus thailandicus]